MRNLPCVLLSVELPGVSGGTFPMGKGNVSLPHSAPEGIDKMDISGKFQSAVNKVQISELFEDR